MLDKERIEPFSVELGGPPPTPTPLEWVEFSGVPENQRPEIMDIAGKLGLTSGEGTRVLLGSDFYLTELLRHILNREKSGGKYAENHCLEKAMEVLGQIAGLPLEQLTTNWSFYEVSTFASGGQISSESTIIAVGKNAEGKNLIAYFNPYRGVNHNVGTVFETDLLPPNIANLEPLKGGRIRQALETILNRLGCKDDGSGNPPGLPVDIRLKELGGGHLNPQTSLMEGSYGGYLGDMGIGIEGLAAGLALIPVFLVVLAGRKLRLSTN